MSRTIRVQINACRDFSTASAIFAYCKATSRPCWVTHIRPELRDLPYPGTSVQLIFLTETGATIELANREVLVVNPEEISLNLDYDDMSTPQECRA